VPPSGAIGATAHGWSPQDVADSGLLPAPAAPANRAAALGGNAVTVAFAGDTAAAGNNVDCSSTDHGGERSAAAPAGPLMCHAAAVDGGTAAAGSDDAAGDRGKADGGTAAARGANAASDAAAADWGTAAAGHDDAART